MKKFGREVLEAGLVALIMFGIAAVPAVAGAAEFVTGEQASFASGETLNSDLYLAGRTVTSAGSVTGDAMLAGTNVVESGLISNDLGIAGATVIVTGDVGGDVRAVGGNITIQGKVGEDVVVAGGEVALTGESIGGSVAAAGGTILLSAPVHGDVKIYGGEVTIDAPITGNVTLHAKKVALGENAHINGSLSYTAPEEAAIASGASIVGETHYEKSAFAEKKIETNTPVFIGALAAFFTVALFIKFLSTLVAALFIAYFFRRYSHDLVVRAAAKPWPEILRGFIFLVALPVASLMLLFTVVGFPLAFLGFITFGVMMVFVSILTPVVTGSLVYKWITKSATYVVDWKTIVLGIVVYFVLGVIPFVGWIIDFALFLLTLGAILSIKWEVIKEWR